MTQPESNPSIIFAHEASLGMPGSIKQVADFLLAEGTGIAQLTMGQIAARAYTSKPTLVRFAKQAGYAGWKDYRHDFLVAMAQHEARQAHQMEVDVNAPVTGDSSPDEVVANLTRIRQLAADEVNATLDRAALSGAAQALLSAREAAHFGVMQNYHRGKMFASDLSLIGILCHTPHVEEATAISQFFKSGDCVVVTSYSGGLTHAPMTLVPAMHDRGVTIVAVTNSTRSQLGELADYVLAFPPLEHYHSKVGSFYSGTCTQLILDALYACCYARHFDESSHNRKSLVEGLGDIIPPDF